MGIFSRLTDIVNSNLNALLDRAEDPEKIIRLIIQEMEDTLVEVRSTAVRMIAERKELERRIETLRVEAADWERKAEFALTKDREDLAKGALLARSRLQETLAGLERQRAQIAEALAKQNEDIGNLQAKLADAKSREATITARQKSAAARIRIRSRLHDDRITDALSRFEQVERALDELEGRVESFDLGRGGEQRRKNLAEALADIEGDSKVEEELSRLKERLGNRLRRDDDAGRGAGRENGRENGR